MKRNSKYVSLSPILQELHKNGEILLIPFQSGLDQVQVSATKNGFDSEEVEILIANSNLSETEKRNLGVKDFIKDDKLRSPLVAKLGLQYPNIETHGANFGIRLGEFRDKTLIMLDIDSDKNSDLIKDMLLDKFPTYTETSKSGKYHLFYWFEDDKAPRAKGWFKGEIDDGTRTSDDKPKACIEIVSNGHTYLYPARYKQGTRQVYELKKPELEIQPATINNKTFIEMRDLLLTNKAFVKVKKAKPKTQKMRIEAGAPKARSKLAYADYKDIAPKLVDLLAELVVATDDGSKFDTMKNVGNAIAIIGDQDFRDNISQMVDDRVMELDYERFGKKKGWVRKSCDTSHNTEMDYYRDHGLVRNLLPGIDKDFWNLLPKVGKQSNLVSPTSFNMLYATNSIENYEDEDGNECQITTIQNKILHRNLSHRWGSQGYHTILLDLETMEVFDGIIEIHKKKTDNGDQIRQIIYNKEGDAYSSKEAPQIEAFTIVPYIIDVAEKELGIRRFNKYLNQLWIEDGQIHKEFAGSELLAWIKNRFNMKDSSALFMQGIVNGLNIVAEKDYQHVLFKNGILLNGDTLQTESSKVTEQVTKNFILWKTIDLDYICEDLDLTPNLDHPNPTVRAFTRIFIPKDNPTDTSKYYNALEKIGNMLRSNNYYKCIWIIVGEGDEGKSIFISILMNIFEKFIKTATPAQFDKDSRFSIVEFDGKNLVVSETGRKNFGAIDALKRMSGNDSLSGEIKGVQGLFECQPPALIIIATNHIPDFDTDEVALMNRLDITKLKNQWKKPGDFNKNLNHYPVQTVEEQNHILTDPEGLTLLLNMGIQAAQQMGQDYTGRTTNEENKLLIEDQDPVYNWICENIIKSEGNHVPVNDLINRMEFEKVPFTKKGNFRINEIKEAIRKHCGFDTKWDKIRPRKDGERYMAFPDIQLSDRWILTATRMIPQETCGGRRVVDKIHKDPRGRAYEHMDGYG